MDVDHAPTGREDDGGAMVELAEMFNSYGDAVVLRTHSTDSFDAILRDSTIPVINGGNGDVENPSQALVDLYTLFKWRPELMFPDVSEEMKLEVGFFGAPRSYPYGTQSDDPDGALPLGILAHRDFRTGESNLQTGAA